MHPRSDGVSDTAVVKELTNDSRNILSSGEDLFKKLCVSVSRLLKRPGKGSG